MSGSTSCSCGCTGETRAFRTSTILKNTVLNDEIFLMQTGWCGAAPKPGQFFLIKPVRSATFLGRPISVCSWDGPEYGAGVLGFMIALRGEGTRELKSLVPGDEIELTGPLGNDWLSAARDLLAAKDSDCSDTAKPLALLGGGIGLAPLLQLAKGLPAGDFDFLAGFRSRPFGMVDLEARAVILATEDGCEGCEGRIPDQLDPRLYRAVYACGPDPMLRAVAEKCAHYNTPCLVSLERHMACGVGACLGCTVATKSGNKRCCADGPIFDAREIFY